MPLSTTRTPRNTPAEHASDTNTVHAFVNDHPTDAAGHTGLPETAITGLVADLAARETPNLYAAGEEVYARTRINSTAVTCGTGSLRLTYFTARRSETITQAKVRTGATAAGATPTIIRIGLWTTDATGALLALVASTPNDTTLLAATATAYTKAFSASYAKVLGQRYALGLLVVTAAAAPQLLGRIELDAAEAGVAPRLCGAVAGQTDLPATVAAGSVTDSVNNIYAVVLP
jgi:hypothetical protein